MHPPYSLSGVSSRRKRPAGPIAFVSYGIDLRYSSCLSDQQYLLITSRVDSLPVFLNSHRHCYVLLCQGASLYRLSLPLSGNCIKFLPPSNIFFTSPKNLTSPVKIRTPPAHWCLFTFPKKRSSFSPIIFRNVM